MIHSRIKRLHTKEDTATKQKTIRSQNTISEKDCGDLTKINRQRKHEGLIEVSQGSNCFRIEIVWKGNAVVSRRKERARRFYKVGCSKVKLEQEGKVSCGKVCKEGCWRVRCEQKICGARWVELEVALAVGVRRELTGGGAGIPLDKTDKACRWSELEMMTSKENAVASLSKVDPSPFLQHFSTFPLRIYCSVVYWQSCGGGAGIRKQATFLNVRSQWGTLR